MYEKEEEGEGEERREVEPEASSYVTPRRFEARCGEAAQASLRGPSDGSILNCIHQKSDGWPESFYSDSSPTLCDISPKSKIYRKDHIFFYFSNY